MMRLLSLFLLLGFLGCSSVPAKSVNPSADLYIRSEFSADDNYTQQKEVSLIAAKLSKYSLNLVPSECEQPGTFTASILKSEKEFSLITSSGNIYLSKTLINRLKSNQEIAFILAHEIAHSLLCHQTDEQGAIHTAKENELAADKLAVKIMQTAGYDPRAAIPALSHAYFSYQPNQPNNTHPDLSLRIKNVTTAINFDEK